MDWIVTGASRGIGRALALALRSGAKQGDRLFALARDAERLRELGEWVVPVPVDLSRVKDARLAGERLAAEVKPGAVLVHNAGLWPSKLELARVRPIAWGRSRCKHRCSRRSCSRACWW